MQLTKRCRVFAGKGLKELYRGRDGYRRIPKKGKCSVRLFLKFRLVVMSSDYPFLCFTFQQQRFTLYINRLVNNVGERQYNKHAAQTFLLGGI